MSIHDAVIIKITGDSGDGVQILGEQLTLTAALTGRDVRTLPDFPAEIRAPAGTVSGVSGFQLAMSEGAIFTAGERLDVLVAMNPAALKTTYASLKPGGLLIINEDGFTAKDYEKSGVSPDFLEQIEAQILSVPMLRQTLEVLKSLDISHAEAKKTKNFYVLGVVLWLFDLPLMHCEGFIAQKFKKNKLMQEANRRALKAGYDYADTLELSRQQFMVSRHIREAGEYRQITGIEAVGLALATLGSATGHEVFVAGYPITPSSAILHECVKLQSFGVTVFQAEDEIAAVCACLGAAFGGALALTTTSGPGLDLKSEGLGLGVMTELPMVVVDVQRAGASTGLPTKTGQSDLRQALFGRHGEAPLPVLAPSSAKDCFDVILEAFRIATTFMTPVIVLMDAYLANSAEPWLIPDPNTLELPRIEHHRLKAPYARDERLSRSWNLPGTPDFIHQIGGLEKQGDWGRVSYEANNHQEMIALRAEKIENIRMTYDPLMIEGDPNAQTLVVCFGSTYGAVKSAVDLCIEEGCSIAMLNLKYLHPLPKDLGVLLKSYRHVLVAELNTGQLCHHLRGTYLVDAVSIQQCNGQPFTEAFLLERLKTECQHEYNIEA